MIVFYIFFILSLACFSYGVVYLVQHRKQGWSQLLFSFLLYFFLSLFLIRIPYCYDSVAEKVPHLCVKSTISGAFIHTLQSFSLDEEYDLLFSTAVMPWRVWAEEGRLSSFVALFYASYLVVLNFLAPLMSGSLILSLISKFIIRIRLALYGNREKYIFSEINEITVSQGEGIRAGEAGTPKARKAVLIYTDYESDEEKEKQAEFLGKLEKLGAIRVHEDISHLKLKHNNQIPVSFVFASSNQDLNIRNAAKLLETTEWSDCILSNMYIYASEGDGEAIVQNLINDIRRGEKRERWANLRVFSVDKATAAVEQLMIDVPLYTRMDSDQCSVLILGGGDIGEAALKIISWCAQMDRTQLHIRLVDKNAEAIERCLRKKASLLFDNPEYDIGFYSCDVFSDTFADYIQNEVSDVDYVLIALGNDSNNIKAALDLQRQYNIIHLDGSIAPVISYSVKLPELSLVMTQDAENEVDGSRCLLKPFGDAKQTFSLEQIQQSRLEKMALAVHLMYYGLPLYLSPEDTLILQCVFSNGLSLVRTAEEEIGISKRYEYVLRTAYAGTVKQPKHPAVQLTEEDKERYNDLKRRLSEREQAIVSFYDSVYNHSSSKSSATHLVYYFPGMGMRPRFGCPDVEQTKAYKTGLSEQDNRMRISRVEHRRWNAFMAAQGYRCPTEQEFYQYAFIKGNKHDNKPLRLHPCIQKWDEDKGFELNDEDFERYERKDPDFMNGRYLRELDDLDRASLAISAHPLNKKKKVDYKTLDRAIIEAADQILSIRDESGMIL